MKSSKIYYNEALILMETKELGRITTAANDLPSNLKVEAICLDNNIARQQVQVIRISTTEWLVVTELPKSKRETFKERALLP